MEDLYAPLVLVLFWLHCAEWLRNYTVASDRWGTSRLCQYPWGEWTRRKDLPPNHMPCLVAHTESARRPDTHSLRKGVLNRPHTHVATERPVSQPSIAGPHALSCSSVGTPSDCVRLARARKPTRTVFLIRPLSHESTSGFNVLNLVSAVRRQTEGDKSGR